MKFWLCLNLFCLRCFANKQHVHNFKSVEKLQRVRNISWFYKEDIKMQKQKPNPPRPIPPNATLVLLFECRLHCMLYRFRACAAQYRPAMRLRGPLVNDCKTCTKVWYANTLCDHTHDIHEPAENPRSHRQCVVVGKSRKA